VRLCHCRYVRVLGAFYLRLTGTDSDVYLYLEPLYNDYRKLRRKQQDGRESSIFISIPIPAPIVESKVDFCWLIVCWQSFLWLMWMSSLMSFSLEIIPAMLLCPELRKGLHLWLNYLLMISIYAYVVYVRIISFCLVLVMVPFCFWHYY